MYAKAPSHEEWTHICTLALDMVMGQLHSLSFVSHQKELLVLNKYQAGHSEKQRNLFSFLGLKPHILHGTYNIAQLARQRQWKVTLCKTHSTSAETK